MARHLTIALLALLASAGHAAAQTQPATTRWEIEGVGGVALSRMRPSGSSALPDPGRPLTTNSPIFPTRATASWFFGDGAAMLNEVTAQLGLSERIAPLDPVLGSIGFDKTSVAAFGVRVRRGVTPRLWAEISLEVLRGPATLSDELVAAAEASRASFETAFAALFASGPFTDTQVTAHRTVAGRSSREIATTGGVNLAFGAPGAFTPYLTLGGGLVFPAGSGPSIVLEGNYRSMIDGVAPIDETDRATLRLDTRRGLVAVVGGGVRRSVTDRWGLRIDGRAFIGQQTARLRLDAEPTVVQGAPPGSIELLTYPNIQFSNNPSTGRRSTLSGAAIEGFEAFNGEGVQVRFLISIGVFTRF